MYLIIILSVHTHGRLSRKSAIHRVQDHRAIDGPKFGFAELRPNYSARFGSAALCYSAELRYYSALLFCHVVARTTSCSHRNLALACVLHVQCLQVHGSAPGRYLQEVIQPVTEVTSRRRLRSALGKAPERLLSDLFKYSFSEL